jgi:hypothetical protein
MPRIEVNLDAGLNTQDDPKRVGFNGFTTLENVRHVNGKLIKRYGTGTQSSAITGNTDCKITNADIFVHRKLTGVKIVDVNTNNLTFTSTTTLTIGGTINTTNIKIPGGSTDLTTIFKAGDTIVLSTNAVVNGGGACTNKDKALVISSVTTNTIVFTTAVANEAVDNNGSAGQHATISFIFDRQDDGATPNNLQINDGNSYDGRALMVTWVDGSDMRIGMLNANDYGDLDTIDILSGASDMHIRMKTYTDGVRFACGLEHSPLLLKYVNRHHFNGMLQRDYNADAHTMYPTFFIDEAVPIISANTITENNSSTPKYIDGLLDLKNNTYDYKFVPVYDGVQEVLLESPILEGTTRQMDAKLTEPLGILSAERSAYLMTGKIDLQLLNPRMSAINVYRSTNGGTYFKIKSIYMGDNDPNQKQVDLYGARDTLWFKGDTTPSADTDFDSYELIIDGFRYEPHHGNLEINFNSSGYHLVNTNDSYASTFGNVVRNDANMSSEYYGSYNMSKFNHPSEATELIFADSGDVIGGSPNGGWYFAGAETIDIIDDGTDIDPPGASTADAISLTQGDTDTPGPFTTNFTTTNSGDGGSTDEIHLKFWSSGAANTDMKRWRLGGSAAVSTTKHIISGWIRAEGFSDGDARWRLFVSDSSGHDQESAEGLQDIAIGKGGTNQNIDKWRWFQYEITPSSTTLYMYYFNYIPDNVDNAAVYVKGLSVRPAVSNYTFDDNLVGFAGKDIGMSKAFQDEGLQNGILKGNSIQIHLDNAYYPTRDYTDRSVIVDNVDGFVRVEDMIPDLGNNNSALTPDSDTFFYSTSNYQFYSYGTNGANDNDMNQYMLFDFYDPGLPDGTRHQNDGVTSLDVKFKYATMLNGRQFVANVKITGDEDTEEYPNFVMYSNPGAPDIIPTSNFIKLDDLQGGEIVGIESLMSDIVVFMTKGIFRISIPSADPSNWSLVEAHPNIGCLHDKGITKTPNGIFFLSQEDVIFLNSGFSATPITYPIRDEYQANVASSSAIMKTHYDVKYNKLYITKSVSTTTFFWTYDILRQTWATEKHGSVGYDEFALDNDNNTLLIESSSNGSGGSGNNSYIRKAVNTSSYQDKGSQTITIKAWTGEQELTPYDQNAYIRRVNTNTNKGGGSVGMELEVGGEGMYTVTKEEYLDGVQSTRTSQRGKSVRINITDQFNENNVREISKVDVEYE